MPLTKVFFDASAIFACIYSDTGGSNKLARLAQDKELIAVTTESVIKEVKENSDKFKQPEVDIDSFLQQHKFFVGETITENDITPYERIVDKRDAHVIAGALLTGCDHLVTLDKKHLDNEAVKEKIRQLQIHSPKSMLQFLGKAK